MASVRVGVAALRVNPLRTLLATLGVIIGVASLVAVLSLGDGMEAYARKQVERTTSVQNVFVSPITHDTVDGIRVAREQWPLFGKNDVADAERRVPGLGAVGLTYGGTTLITPPAGGRERAANVAAASASVAGMSGVELRWGRFFTPAEVRDDAPVVVLSYTAAKTLSPTGQPAAMLGQTLRLRGVAMRVIGISGEDEREGRAMSALVPLGLGPAVMTADEAARPRRLVLKAKKVEEVEAVRAAAGAWLTRRYGPWQKRFEISTDQARSAQMKQAFLVFKLFMGAITAISLLVGGIGIMNVLLSSVTERTREIGIRKAVGARRRDIVLQFLSESVAITGSGSLIGLLLGVAAAFGITAGMRAYLDAPIHAGLSLSTMMVAAASAVIVGLSFGTYPAVRASRLSPVDAIRHE
ncbi:putative ABC transport system permease protein [bacterium JGI 053]|nr:putative ABC transport system permease protein [bacterium JGI 053]